MGRSNPCSSGVASEPEQKRENGRVELPTSAAGPWNVFSLKTQSYARSPEMTSPSRSTTSLETNAPRLSGPPTTGSELVLFVSSWFM